MPSSPARLCLDCSSRAITGTKYCETHTVVNASIEHKRLYDKSRANDECRKLYRTKRWQRTRQIVFNRDPLCKSCGHRASTDCDHILSARIVLDSFGINAFYDIDRLQGLCHRCHSKKTATESGWAGNKPANDECREQHIRHQPTPVNTTQIETNQSNKFKDLTPVRDRHTTPHKRAPGGGLIL
jgi:5-methylcytosine-specific restriction protein A